MREAAVVAPAHAPHAPRAADAPAPAGASAAKGKGDRFQPCPEGQPRPDERECGVRAPLEVRRRGVRQRSRNGSAPGPALDLECAAPDGWVTLHLRLTRAELDAAAADVTARGRLLGALDVRLRGCRRQT